MLSKQNVALRLSIYAVLTTDGRLKALTCGCDPAKAEKHKCRSCTCGKLRKPCVRGHCKCLCSCAAVGLGGSHAPEAVEAAATGASAARVIGFSGEGIAPGRCRTICESLTRWREGVFNVDSGHGYQETILSPWQSYITKWMAEEEDGEAFFLHLLVLTHFQTKLVPFATAGGYA